MNDVNVMVKEGHQVFILSYINVVYIDIYKNYGFEMISKSKIL